MAELGAGLKVGGKTYPVTIISKDTQSNSNRAAEVTNELILNDHVDLVLVSSAPETVNPVSDQCELNGTPCISTVAPWQAWMFNRGSNPQKGFESTFHFFWGFEDIISVFANMWDSITTNRKVGGLFPNDEDGRAWSEELGLWFGFDETGLVRIYEPDGRILLTQEEEHHRAEAEARRIVAPGHRVLRARTGQGDGRRRDDELRRFG